jgi:ubiquinone/menaquinone biosynthesis C-methylase UbiE
MSQSPSSNDDRWARWLLHDRHNADPQQLQATLEQLAPIREQLHEHADIREGDTVLDVGAETGMIAFAALEQVGSFF